VVDGYVAAFVPFARTGNLIYLSAARKEEWKALVRQARRGDLPPLQGTQAARGVAIELLATLQAAVGDLNDLRRIVKLLVFVNSGSHFTEPHVVANGASELFIEVFGERGAHARSALGVSHFRLVAALRSRWLWRHFYQKVNANCEIHTKKKQSGYESKSFAIPGGTMRGA
jgi:enamine deaminase RidA (YjgF/YER057c/UK114 family)